MQHTELTLIFWSVLYSLGTCNPRSPKISKLIVDRFWQRGCEISVFRESSCLLEKLCCHSTQLWIWGFKGVRENQRFNLKKSCEIVSFTSPRHLVSRCKPPYWHWECDGTKKYGGKSNIKCQHTWGHWATRNSNPCHATFSQTVTLRKTIISIKSRANKS